MLSLAAKHSRPLAGPSRERPSVSLAARRVGVLADGELAGRGVARRFRQQLVRQVAKLGVEMAAQNVAEERAKRHYAEHEGKAFFNGLVEYITSFPIVAMVVEGPDAVEGCRASIGVTNPIKAAPGSIRGDFGQTIGRNLVHGSDSPESAKREIALWFERGEIFPRPHEMERWLVST